MTTYELIKSIISNELANLNFCLPAKIVKYEFKTRKATVQPLINQKFTDDEIVEMPLIHNVPVVHPASGGASITFPVDVGDTVQLIFSQKSLEEWLKDGKQVTPDDPRQFDLTDAIAHIGFKPFSEQVPAESAEDLVIDYDGSTITIHPEGVVDIDAEEINMAAPTVNVESNAVNITAPTVTMTSDNVNVSGKITAANIETAGEMKSGTAVIGGKAFATHTHGGVTPGVGTTGVVS